jgi:hypothetical protein
MIDEKTPPSVHHCPIWEEWRAYMARADRAFIQVNTMHGGINDVVENTKHLRALSDIRDRILDSATGRDHIPTKVVLVVLATFGTVILGLTFTIVFLLTGEATGWINALHR